MGPQRGGLPHHVVRHLGDLHVDQHLEDLLVGLLHEVDLLEGLQCVDHAPQRAVQDPMIEEGVAENIPVHLCPLEGGMSEIAMPLKQASVLACLV